METVKLDIWSVTIHKMAKIQPVFQKSIFQNNSFQESVWGLNPFQKNIFQGKSIVPVFQGTVFQLDGLFQKEYDYYEIKMFQGTVFQTDGLFQLSKVHGFVFDTPDVLIKLITETVRSTEALLAH